MATKDLNIENFRKARKWIADAKHFRMEHWLTLGGVKDYADIERQWRDDNPTAWKSPEGVAAWYFEQGSTRPCGTAACAAGEIFLNATTADERREQGSGAIEVESFGADFLGLSAWQADQLFRNDEGFYGPYSLTDVTKEMVLTKFDEIIDTGVFPNA